MKNLFKMYSYRHRRGSNDENEHIAIQNRYAKQLRQFDVSTIESPCIIGDRYAITSAMDVPLTTVMTTVKCRVIMIKSVAFSKSMTTQMRKQIMRSAKKRRLLQYSRAATMASFSQTVRLSNSYFCF